MLVAALVATAVALERGAPPAAAIFMIYLGMMPIVAGLERLQPHLREWNTSRRDLLADSLYLPTTWGLGAFLSPAFAAVAVAIAGFASEQIGTGLWPSALCHLSDQSLRRGMKRHESDITPCACASIWIHFAGTASDTD